MKTTSLRLLAPVLLVLANGTPAVAQTGNEPASQFFNFVCEIDLSVLPLPPGFTLADGTTSVFTFDSRRLCTGEASTRNVKVECEDIIPGWNQGNQSAKGFTCTINGDTCGLAPRPGDPSAPFLTATDSSLTVGASGAAKLLCFYKP
jgi:hypothetical protein